MKEHRISASYNLNSINQMKAKSLNEANFLLIDLKRKENINKERFNVILNSSKITNKEFNCSMINKSYVLNNNKLWKQAENNLKQAIIINNSPRNQRERNNSLSIIQTKANLNELEDLKDLMVKEMKESFNDIERKLKNQMRNMSLQQEVEKIELNHIEGKLATEKMNEFKVENFADLIQKRRKAVFFSNAKNQSIIDKMSPVKRKKTDIKKITSKLELLELEEEKYGVKFDEEETKIIHNFILEQELEKNKDLSKLRKLLGKESKLVNSNKIIKSSDEETNTKTKYISHMTNRFNKILNIIYPKLMTTKQNKINCNIKLMRDRIKNNNMCKLRDCNVLVNRDIVTNQHMLNRSNSQNETFNFSKNSFTSRSFYNKFTQAESFYNKAKKIDKEDVIFSNVYENNPSLTMRIKQKFLEN